MADRKYNGGSQGDESRRSAEDKALDKFAEMMISQISAIQSDWKKPWFTEGALSWPKNLSGREYNGMNALMLMMHCEQQGFKIPVFCTFDRVTGLNYMKDKQGDKKQALDDKGEKLPTVSILKGSKSFPVFITTYSVVNKDTKERIKYDDYKQMSEESRKDYNVYPKLTTYNVFNVQQTNLHEARPELYQKLLEQNGQSRPVQREGDMFSFPAIDHMVEHNEWICPIKPTYGDDAYYSISKNEIVIPEKRQFKDGESWTSNLIHEMSHSTGCEAYLNRLKPSSFASSDYAKEELIAELTAALVSQRYGMSKHIKEDSCAYLKNWLDSLKEEPQYIKTVLMDVKRASAMITQRVDAIQAKLDQGNEVKNGAAESKSQGNAQKEAVELDIPKWAIPYIFNGDASGISDEEKDMVDKYMEKNFPDGYIPDIIDGQDKDFNLYPAFGERNENALPSRGESPYQAVDTVKVRFSPGGYFESEGANVDLSNTTIVVDNTKDAGAQEGQKENVAAKMPPKEETQQEEESWHYGRGR